MTRKRLVVIGNGMAAIRTVEELLKISPDAYDITVFGAEPHGNYNRILLSPVLAGEKTVADIMLNDDPWYAEQQITLYKGDRIIAIDRERREVVSEAGVRVEYDRLLIATGSNPFMIPLPGHDLPGVLSFRDIGDVDRMVAAAQAGQTRAVVIGGGLLGLEAANGLMKQGMEVTVVHLLDSLMERQLDKPAARLLQASLEARGMHFRMQAQTEAILGDGRVQGVRFKDGSEVEADLLVMAVGIRPNVALARESGLAVDRGIQVDDAMRTSDLNIFAIGECVEHRGLTYGLVAPIWEQAKVCAAHLAEASEERPIYEGSVTSTKLKVTGIDLFSAGDFNGGEGTEDIVFQDPRRGIYKRVVLKDDRLVGAVLYGDTGDGSWYFQLMREGTPVTDFRDVLLFGQAHLGDSGRGGADQVSHLPADAEICGCNGVCKGTIVEAVAEHKLTTLDDVRARTKASSSCGSCTGLVEQLLANALGGDYDASPRTRPMCPCTDASHEEVREAIRAEHLVHMDAVRERFGWKRADGCAKCRPALNYYLLSSWPEEAVDDPQSRFINERAHANIQKDGTYSVIPRIFGGVTTPAELRAIAEVAERYEVPTVKITGGQRIDLLGITKEQLPAVWRDLNHAGFVSGHAYGKALRTVKTCVGSEWCRFGTQDSTQLGIDLEQLTWGSWTPHKVKMAVSGCPRNCAESTIKDFGVICVDSGYELLVGGNGGTKLRGTDFLCHVKTPAEVEEYAAAFMQVYREEAHYLERTAPWIERVGLDYVKQRVVEDASGRAELAARFRASQALAQHDPWAQHALEHQRPHEFQPLKEAV